jgi:hypothetical protein
VGLVGFEFIHCAETGIHVFTKRLGYSPLNLRDTRACKSQRFSVSRLAYSSIVRNAAYVLVQDSEKGRESQSHQITYRTRASVVETVDEVMPLRRRTDRLVSVLHCGSSDWSVAMWQ